jgi:indole-3-glycerol phosphate synthase
LNVLDKIVQRTRETIIADRAAISSEELEQRIIGMPPCRDFAGALAAGDEVQLIAEVKKASPSAGLIREDFDPPSIARCYEEGGAACCSVLTDEPFFQGSLQYLRQVRAAVELPILRKDFIVDRYQLLQAREVGADCVLLIAECLDRKQLKDLYDQALELGLQSLIELYDAENLDAVLDTGCPMVGVNNRDLRTFETSLQHTLDIGRNVPRDRILVGESGIFTRADVDFLASGGVKAILVGESLMRQRDIAEATRKLLAR